VGNSGASNKRPLSGTRLIVLLSILYHILGPLSPSTLFTIKRAGDCMQGLSLSFLIHITVRSSREHIFFSVDLNSALFAAVPLRHLLAI
jgi:hypothetical protein